MTSRGLTLVEVMIVIVIAGGVMLLIPLLARMSERSLEQSAGRLTDEEIITLSLKQLSKELSRSYVMRMGYLDCTSSASMALFPATLPAPMVVPAPVQLFTNITVEEKEDNVPIQFAFSEVSALAARHPSEASNLIVPDAAIFPSGSLVLVTEINDSLFGGLFMVRNSRPNNNPPTIELTENITIPPELTGADENKSQCITTLKNQFLKDILDSHDHYVFGAPPRTFKLDRVTLVSYFAVRAQDGSMKLERKSWPPLKQDEAIPGFRALKIDALWTRSSQDRTEHFNASINLTTRAKSAAVPQVRTGRAEYDLSSSLLFNMAARVNPPPDVLSGSSCGLSHVTVDNMYDYADPIFEDQYQPLISIEATFPASSGSSAVVDLQFGGSRQCWNSSSASDINAPLGADLPILLGNGNASPPPIPSGESVICRMGPGSSAEGLLRYYDGTRRREMRIPCSGFTVPAIPNFTYRPPIANRPCERDSWVINDIGSLTSVIDGSSGPRLRSLCRYANTVGLGFEDCRVRPDTGFVPQLIRVRPQPPANIVINPAPADLVCN